MNVFILIAVQCRSQNINELLTCVDRELEAIRVREDIACPIPLYRAVRAFHRALSDSQGIAGETGPIPIEYIGDLRRVGQKVAEEIKIEHFGNFVSP